MPTVLLQVKASRQYALEVTTATRSLQFPDAPTVAGAALPEYEAAGWFDPTAPTGTPSDTNPNQRSRFHGRERKD